MHIAGATSIDDRLHRAIREDFYLAEEIPLPGDLSEAIRFINKSDPRAIRCWWSLQSERVENLVEDLTEKKKLWGAQTPE